MKKPVFLSVCLALLVLEIGFLAMLHTRRPQYVEPRYNFRFSLKVEGYDEILLCNGPSGGYFVTYQDPDIVPDFVSGETEYNIDVLPDGCYYVTYLPEPFRYYTALIKRSYLNAGNIDSISRPFETEENRTGVFSMFKAKESYEDQLQSLSLLFSSYRHDEQNLYRDKDGRRLSGADFLITNRYLPEDLCDSKFFESASSMKKNSNFYDYSIADYIASDIKVTEYEHPLFDKAYIVTFNSKDGKWGKVTFKNAHFYGYKFLDTSPISYYDLTYCPGEITQEDLALYLKTSNVFEFSIEALPQSYSEEYELTKDELIKMVDSIMFKGARD